MGQLLHVLIYDARGTFHDDFFSELGRDRLSFNGPRSQRRDGRAAPSDGFRALHLAVEAGSLQIVLDLCRQLAL